MTRKHEPGTLTVKRRQPVVDGREIVAAIREGRLTRGQFDAWHSLRRRSTGSIVITMRPSADDPPRRARVHRPR
jgi:hypothetical protein